MNKNEAVRCLEAMRWHFAKSMPTIPHAYARRREWSGDNFDDVVEFIRSAGVAEAFYSKSYIYFYHGEYKYWTMGSPVHETILINRANS